ncbi:MAG: hypothetical protein ACRDKX_04965 [Solirubrobacterales bacterium]
MRILLVNQQWPAFGGSETYLLTIAAPLQRLGHEVLLYAPAGGETVDAARERGIALATRTGELPDDPHAVITQDGEGAYAMAERYPDAVRPYVIHSSVFEPQRPPQLRDVCHLIIALNGGMYDQATSLGLATPVTRLTQPVDLDRFTDRGGRGGGLRRVLMLGNHWGGPGYRNYEAVAATCGALGAEVDLVGVGGRVSTTPEIEIASSDVVIGLGRCVVEAMASARAAYVFGNTGGDGWVTPEGYQSMEALGFAGGSDGVAIDARRLRADLERFDADMGQVNRQLAIAHHDAHRHAAALVGLIEQLEPKPVADPAALAVLARLVRVQWETESRVALAEADSRRLRVDVGGLRAELDQRRHRLARALARPLDAVRRRRRR